MRPAPLFETTPPSALAGAPLWTSPVLFLDAQATGAHSSGGEVIEIGWASGPACGAAGLAARDVQARLIACGHGLPPAVTRVTGLCAADLAGARGARDVWRELEGALPGPGGANDPVPTVVHFARFEEPFLRDINTHHGRVKAFPLHLVCTHAIARRLLPGLPRRTLRALAGYLGRSVPTLRRSAEHVLATAFVWHHLVRLLDEAGVGTFGDLGVWLEQPAPRHARVYPMPRERRLRLADSPGVYRLLRANGDVLYVGKAGSLRQRVNSHFRGHAGRDERALEMLTQARDLACTPTETALEAALLEADEIKRLRPPYNVALAVEGRAAWFASADYGSIQDHPDDRHPIGPFASPVAPEAISGLVAALSGAAPTALTRGRCLGVEPRWAPDPESFASGLARFLQGQPLLVAGAGPRQLRLAGAALWRRRLQGRALEGAVEEPVLTPPASARWTAERVEDELGESLVCAAHAVRRARWLCRLSESVLCWTEPRGWRRLVIERGEVTRRDWIVGVEPLPVPPGHARPMAERRTRLGLAALDRMRVLNTELRRVVATAPSVELRFGPHARLDRRGLARVLVWV